MAESESILGSIEGGTPPKKVKPLMRGASPVHKSMTPASFERVDRLMRSLTPQEKHKIQYHRDNLPYGARDRSGNPMTIYAQGPKIRRGRYEGKFASVPGWVPRIDRKPHYPRDDDDPMTEDQAYDYWEDEIEAGTWPIYGTGPALNARDKELHTIMDEDLPGFGQPRYDLNKDWATRSNGPSFLGVMPWRYTE